MEAKTIIAASFDSKGTILVTDNGENIFISSQDPVMNYVSKSVVPALALHGKATYLPKKEEELNVYKACSESEIAFYEVCKTVVDAFEKLSSEKFKEQLTTKYKGTPLDPDNTIVAKTNDGIVAGIEKLDPYFKYSAKNHDCEGVKNLIKRMAKIADKRKHSVDSLLDFLKHAELPITSKGDIVAYKALDHWKGDIYVDAYSRRVKQSIGSLVCMPIEAVDDNRFINCSNGLHIASRSYLQHYCCTDCFLVLVKPEDVISVPYDDYTKIRVCAYRIVAHLSPEQRSCILDDKPITEAIGGEELLKKVFNYDIPPIKEKVFVAYSGADSKNTSYAVKKDKPTKKVKKVTTLDDVEKDIVLSKEEQKANLLNAKVAVSPIKMLKAGLENNSLTSELVATVNQYRKKQKKSWKGMGFTEEQIKKITSYL